MAHVLMTALCCLIALFCMRFSEGALMPANLADEVFKRSGNRPYFHPSSVSYVFVERRRPVGGPSISALLVR
ncbi:MAG: hypothetical protein GPOALKHO_001750 [Sodalis sp.]|nr:MAG: hypothetical protein GPOALKHO_001750 [Sodalis sp.]